VVDEAAALAAKIATLTGLVAETQDLLRGLQAAVLREPRPQTAAVAFAAQILHDMRPALANADATAELLAAARRAGRREGWMKGFAAGRDSREGPALRLVHGARR